MITYSTSAGSRPIRLSASLIAIEPSSVAWYSARPPPSLPNGVRTAETITDRGIEKSVTMRARPADDPAADRTDRRAQHAALEVAEHSRGRARRACAALGRRARIPAGDRLRRPRPPRHRLRCRQEAMRARPRGRPSADVFGTGRESADDWLTREAARLAEAGEPFWLVTSDRELRGRAGSRAERVIGGGSFARELTRG